MRGFGRFGMVSAVDVVELEKTEEWRDAPDEGDEEARELRVERPLGMDSCRKQSIWSPILFYLVIEICNGQF